LGLEGYKRRRNPEFFLKRGNHIIVRSVERTFLSTFKETEGSWVKQDEHGVC
jgi:hypothetical protein